MDSLPTISSFAPSPDTQVLAGQTVRFQVTAMPDGAPVNYTWAVDGVPIQGSQDTFSLPTGPQDPAERVVEVEVESGGSESTVLLWRVSIKKTGSVNAPPAITSTLPESPVSLLRGESLPLTVAANDQDPGDTLTYQWYVDDVLQSGGQSAFRVSAQGLAEGTHTVKVVVDDGVERTSTEESFGWNFDVRGSISENRPPVISSALPMGMLRIVEGSTLRLIGKAADPEGDPVAYHWEVNGAEQPGGGSSFFFRPSGQGSYRVQVVADDGGQLVGPSSFEWLIDVRSSTTFEPPPDTGETNPTGPRIDDLIAAGARSSSLKLRWTAPQMEVGGRGVQYDIRYSTKPLNEAGWSAASRVVSIQAPAAPGASEELTVGNLARQTAYYFGIKTAGPGNVWTPISRLAKGTTLKAMTGKDIYVSTSGSDSGTGTSSSPYRTVSKGVSSSVAGDTVRIRAGIYAGDRMSPRSGTAVISEDGPLKAIIDGQKNVQHLVSILGKDDIVIDGLELRNAGGNTADANDVMWIDGNGSSDGSHNITLRNLFVHGAGPVGDCIKVTNYVYDFVLDDSRLTDSYGVVSGEDEELLDMKFVFGAKVRGNWFYHRPGTFAGAMAYSKTDSKDILFENNIFGPQSTYATDSAVGGGWSSSSVNYNTSGLVIKNNLFIDVHFSAVGAYAAHNEYIYNNVFYNCARGGGGILRIQEGGSIDNSQNLFFINNIIIDDQGKMPAIYIKQSIAGVTNFEHHHNVFWNNGTSVPRGGFADPTQESSYLSANPRFTSPSSQVGAYDYEAMIRNFRILDAGSPAANSGADPRVHPYANVVSDIAGTLRAAPYDRGIFDIR